MTDIIKEESQSSSNETIESIKDEKIDPPVTVTIIRQVKPACIPEFERLVFELSMNANLYPGHLGTNLFRPSDQSSEYRVVYKFDCMSHFRQWSQSKIRAKYYKQIQPLLYKQPEMQILTGLETWFNLPNYKGALVPQPRYKMAVISWLAIYPLVIVILEVLGPILNMLQIPGRAAIITLIAILSMTYIIMPYMSRLFSRWLYPEIPEHITTDNKL